MTDRMNATDKLLICSGCGEQQAIVLLGETEFYEHEGRCPACGEYVVCVGTCIKDDEG